ncbi:hypothetical protein BDY19DRAFT_992009 [Irpex rosettiformis]|uniref:Uncharacterized protein n=1 Tax=Irpex rosettiformis TaxID=378272 RepID=A0ACB8U8R5_9APHY|nr:hypothetical protein BDY19DRAFT_992009 [Irpex rosettiformis]
MPKTEELSPTVYKGKVKRSWAQLPDSLVRLITSHYLALVTPKAGYPSQWDVKELWSSRLIYTALRNANEIEKLMSICAPWHVAIEYHPFWQHGCSVLDPHEQLGHLAFRIPPTTAGSGRAPAIRLSPYRHFQNIATYSCYVCRLNYPYSTHGLANAKRLVASPQLRSVPVCREHRKGTFCAVCLRAAPHDDTNTMVCVAENEDNETWHGIEATCRSCRLEALWKISGANPLDREALGGFPFRWGRHTPDWETRQAIETFVDMGEGCISEVLKLAREKHWLWKYTKLPDMLSQAVAATKYVDRAEAVYEGEGSDEDLSADEDDPELMSLTEDACGVRELAIHDWVRNRILDGHWISPADQYYGTFIPHKPFVRAEHPCPWLGAAYAGAVADGESSGDGEELVHPRPKTYDAPSPPSFQLCEQVFRVYQRVMREILYPAMCNIVRRLVMESQLDGTDPGVMAQKMSLEDVVKELRDQDTWSKGVDWAERRRIRPKQQQEQRRTRSEDDDTSSSRSGSSHTTSPVLSTTTLQTTPSPPPIGGKEEDAEPSPIASSPVIPVPESPSVQASSLIRPIPYVPVTIAHLPRYSMDSIRIVWREACTPLYQCRCSICDRTMLAANTEAGKQPVTGGINAQYQPPPTSKPEKQDSIQLEEHVAVTGHEAEEGETDADAEFDDEIESEFEDTVDFDIEGYVASDRKGANEAIRYRSQTPELPTYRKRSHDEASEEPERGPVTPPARDGTPPKRARLEETPYDKSAAPVLDAPPLYQRKRSSEEAEDNAQKSGRQSPKRVKA